MPCSEFRVDSTRLWWPLQLPAAGQSVHEFMCVKNLLWKSFFFFFLHMTVVHAS